ncbi:MAG: chromosome segregation protein SMC [Candidatus Freyarchaeota archaeon]
MIATVHIKKIVVKGFKSFGNRRVSINFSRGFVVVVGPNGSGKSNLLDAIRFGIGMLSAKSMRASTFSDLIFYSKSKGGRMAKYASVSLYLDNTDRRIPVDSDTVVITRQVDLDGRGTYRLNGRAVSRSQIVDLLEAAGISPDGYNMVPQGEILEVIQKGPVEIRRLFEEIAGISSFDEKKEKAQKELEIAEQNLRENLAQVKEVRNVVERLAREREAAIKYKKLEEEIREAKAKLVFFQLKEKKERLESILREIEGKKKEVETSKERLNSIRDTLSSLQAKVSSLDKEIASLEESRRSLTSKLDEKGRRLSEQKVIVDFKERDLQGKIRQIETLKKEAEGIQRRINVEREELAKLLSDESIISKTASEKQKVLDALYEQAAALDSEHSKLKGELQQLEGKVEELKRRKAELEAERKVLENELSHYQESISVKSERYGKICRMIEAVKGEVKLLREKERKSREKKDYLSRSLKQVEEEIEKVEGELKETENILQRLKEEIIKVKAINEERERILRSQSAVYKILKLRDEGIITGIHGTIAELGSAEEEYALALEAAAGQRLNYVVVENDEVAVKCIEFLKEHRLGRVSFIPLNLIRPRKAVDVKGNGIIGSAVDLIRFDERFRPAFEYVFGNTVIVKDLNVARSLHDLKVRKVTLDGEILETSGLMVGGHVNKRHVGVFQKLEDHSKLENELRGIGEVKKTLLLKVSQLESRRNDILRSIEDADRENYICRNRLNDLTSRLQSLESEVKELEEELETLSSKRSEKEHVLKRVIEEASEISLQIDVLKKEKVRLEEVISNSESFILQTQIRELEKELLTLKDKLNGIRVKIAEKRTLVDGHLKKLLNEKLSAIPLLERERAELEDEVKRLGLVLEAIADDVAQLEGMERELRDKITLLKKEKEETVKKYFALAKEIERLESKINELELELKSAEVERSFVEEALKELEKQAEEYRSYSFSNVESVNIEEIREVIRSKEKEKKRLEPVNMLAIELYEKERRRYDELIEKRNKLIEEREGILNFIREIEKDKRNTFLSTFYAIERNFKRIFSSLSPGGSARFILENPVDPFSGGVIIEARPAGKEVKRLELMSGGEKSITSLALIFAIQQHHPAPFYIMDEIDAFLDEQNASRVADLIKEFSKTSQFIVVSLRKATMKRADQIIGVTYLDGTSHIFSVEPAQMAMYTEQQERRGAVA